MRRLYLTIFLAFAAASGFAQNNTNLTGAQILRIARASYDQGRLFEVEPRLVDALAGLKFNETEKIEALKLLILTYIYLEEPQKADDAMIQLLNTDHFFRVSPADPVEFETLYKKFRVRAVYRWGVKLGGSNTLINPMKVYYVPAEGAGQGKYASNIGFQGGGVFELDLGDKGWKKNLAVTPELLYAVSSWNYTNSSLYWTDFEQKQAQINHTFTQARIQLNALVQYKFADDYVKLKGLIPYVAFGPSVQYLMSAKMDGSYVDEDRVPKSMSVDQKDNLRPINLALILSAGARMKVSSFYINADVRYQHGLMNVVNTANRYDAESALTLLYKNNDFSMNQIMINLGIVVPHFNPKKLVK